VRGYHAKQNVVIPNGVDTDRYHASADLRRKFRGELGLSDQVIVIGMICRIVRWKGVHDFIEAAGQVACDHDNLIFACAGVGDTRYMFECKQRVAELGLGDRFCWLGERADVPTVLNGLDILTVASLSGEGFSNIIGEGMAVGKPIVATNVGDNSRVIADTGIILDPGKHDQIAKTWVKLTKEPKLMGILGSRAASRVRGHFSISKMVDQTEKALFFNECL
jgi:glycosyltransferase involved in cell wall biosynthesis